jgi:hypothetical protein
MFETNKRVRGGPSFGLLELRPSSDSFANIHFTSEGTMVHISDIRSGELVTLTVRKKHQCPLHDSIGLNDSIHAKVLSNESRILHVRVMSRDIGDQIISWHAFDEGIIDIRRRSVLTPIIVVVAVLTFVATIAYFALSSFW